MRLGTINGIKIKLHFSTLLIVGLVGFSAVTFFLSQVPDATLIDIIIVGVLNGIIILVSILIHELFHSIMAQRYGLTVTEIELYLFGGVSKIQDEPRTPKSEFIISGIGPLSSLVLGILFFITLIFTPSTMPLWLSITLLYSGISNIALGFFNLLPAFPMDGGRVLRAYLWRKRNNIISATKTASRIGTFIGYSLMVYGVVQIIVLGSLGGFWLIIMGSFLNKAAKKSYVQTVNEVTLSNINLKDLMGARRLGIPFDLPISDAIKDYFMVYRQSFFPVIRGEEITGIIHFEDIKKIPMEQRSRFIVGYAERSLSEFPDIYEEGSGKDALRKLIEMKNLPHVIVIRNKFDNEITGMISEYDLYNAIKFCQLHPGTC